MIKGQIETGYFDVIGRGLDRATQRYSQLGIANAERNRPHIRQTIKDLVGEAEGRTCLLVSGGPSLLRRKSLDRLKPVMEHFVIVAADGALGHCLRAGIVPDYIVSLDPHGERIVRWFGDNQLTADKLEDDYFRRQDLDSTLNFGEVERNEEQTRLVNAVGPSIRAVLSTSAPMDVRRRCLESGMDIYWWNPIYDDPSESDSITRRLHNTNKVPCMNTGGNVGTAGVIFAARVLNARRVVMLGMDFAYYTDTPIQNTQYFDQFEKFMTAAEIPHAFKVIDNPHLGLQFYTDPAYYWYRKSFLELMDGMMNCDIINATEGGILYGNEITLMSIEDVIELMNDVGVRP